MRRGLDPRTFLLLGLVAGLLAGVVAFTVSALVGEPQVDAAIALEEAAAPAHDHDHASEEAVVSRDTQGGVGLATATIVTGLVLGGGAGLAGAVALGRLGSLRPAASTAVVVALGFWSVGLVPFLKYPANPPAVGDPATIDQRTALYFGFQALSMVSVVVAVVLARRLLPALGAYRAVVLAGLVAIGLVVAAGIALPTVDEVGDFPASLLWRFRLSSLLTLATLWAVIGVVLTGLVGRVAARAQADQQRRALAAAL